MKATGILISMVILNTACSSPEPIQLDQASPPKYDEWTPPPPQILDEDGFPKEDVHEPRIEAKEFRKLSEGSGKQKKKKQSKKQSSSKK